ncbi:MAG: hypothetical protein BMS9Abin05_2486 [Rhodothermia bacterium]|nr:MAG: hypothetical protein BMS9Abin05_2486 [Rhodothermia bacterium]
MGKGLMIMVFGAILAGSILAFQQKQTALETTERQTGYEEEVLAREIARSAYNIASRLAQSAGDDLATAIANINGRTSTGAPDYNGEMTGLYQGGSYSAQGFSVDGQNVKIRATGWFGDAEHTINENYHVKMLVVKDSSKVTLEFLESMAGYCSAVFLQRFIPNKGQGMPTLNKIDAVGNLLPNGPVVMSDDTNYYIMSPEMIMNSGHNRQGTELRVSPDNIVLAPETRVNFFIGVDKDCSEQGLWEESYLHLRYDWVHNALEEDTQNLEDLQEGPYSMIEPHSADDQKWRIAFEDLRSFSIEQHEDIKANSYGGNWDLVLGTYGGSGWIEKDLNGYKKLRDFGWKPDFSDQVIQVSFNSCSGNCYN